MKMDVTEQKNQFVELRSKGWPITKIAESLDLPIPLLCVWLSAEQVRISTLRRRFQDATEAEDLAAPQKLESWGESPSTPNQTCSNFKTGRLRRLPGNSSILKPKAACSAPKHRHP